MLLTQICEHGNITVKEGKATGACRSCNVKIYGYQNGYAERKRFNKTLMREFNTYHEGEKWAKKKGLACIGNEPIESVFKQEKQNFEPIIVDGLKRLKAGKIR